MLDLREKYAADREERQTQAAGEREERAIARERLTREARREEFDLRQVSDAEEMLFKRMDELRKQEAEAISDAFGDTEMEDRIRGQYQSVMDDMIVGHVVRMAQANDGAGVPGYQMDSPGALESKFMQMGMDPDGASQHSINIGRSIWPDSQPTEAEQLFTPTGNFSYIDESGNQVGGGERGAAALARQNVDPVNTGASQNSAMPIDMVGESGRIPPRERDGSLGSIFGGGEPLKNADGSIKHPANKDSLLYRFGNFLNKEIPYGQ